LAISAEPKPQLGKLTLGRGPAFFRDARAGQPVLSAGDKCQSLGVGYARRVRTQTADPDRNARASKQPLVEAGEPHPPDELDLLLGQRSRPGARM